MSTRRNKRRPLAEINVVPYIDVMLVLMVIFMIATPLLHQGVEVELPRAEAESLAPESKLPLVLSVDADGRYYLDEGSGGQLISAEDLVKQVTESLRGRSDTAVLVRGDQALRYGQIITAMSLLQQGGAGQIGLLSEPLGEVSH